MFLPFYIILPHWGSVTEGDEGGSTPHRKNSFRHRVFYHKKAYKQSKKFIHTLNCLWGLIWRL